MPRRAADTLSLTSSFSKAPPDIGLNRIAGEVKDFRNLGVCPPTGDPSKDFPLPGGEAGAIWKVAEQQAAIGEMSHLGRRLQFKHFVRRRAFCSSETECRISISSRWAEQWDSNTFAEFLSGDALKVAPLFLGQVRKLRNLRPEIGACGIDCPAGQRIAQVQFFCEVGFAPAFRIAKLSNPDLTVKIMSSDRRIMDVARHRDMRGFKIIRCRRAEIQERRCITAPAKELAKRLDVACHTLSPISVT